MLYRPTPGEIDAIIQQGIAKQPLLTERYLRAREILCNDDLFTLHDEWFCASQTHANLLYSVNGGCTCADYQNAGAAIQGHIFCKHKLALEAYRRILERHLERRIVGNARFRSDLDRSRHLPNTYLLQLWETNQLGTHLLQGRVPQSICTFRWSKRGRTFATDQEFAKFAIWLATTTPLPTARPDAMATDAERMDYHAWRNHWFALRE